ncbi:MAG TPA: HDOD domain-containing protein [Ramlibacter sp.]|jgi:EAL and modified HD-GYP domain-containing signal transduction protein|uniref:EAL and HDOD domain-containing protein n=1 Tax=Ramlibacter sp. TaxID=1917967 RepID=UPI002D2252C0|nr:HDOD domain-containing protein [Ramlibacter sp.]HZY20705.1 HDOD domain-containing protein [Ramlibacter sp.]
MSEISAPTRDVSVARHSILDQRNAIFAYELVDRSDGTPDMARDVTLLGHAGMLLTSQALAERRLLFIPCSWATLGSEALATVDPEHTVLEVLLPSGFTPEQVLEGAQLLASLRKRGFRLAFAHDVMGSAWRPWLAHASFLKLHFGRLPPAAIPAVIKAARQLPPKLIACGIDDQEQHKLASSLGIELFQGAWFSQPVKVETRSLRPNQAIILELIALLRREADTAEVESLLKRDAALSFNLLRYINSGAFGLTTEVSSFRSAVMLVGMQRLLRWATVLMASSASGAPALGHTAVVRGRLMELLAAELLTSEQCDQAFVVGVFSLLDSMTGVPLERALDGLALPEAVNDALLRRQGLFEPFLSLAEACEGANDEAFAANADRLLLSGHQVNMAHLQALAWAEDLLAA